MLCVHALTLRSLAKNMVYAGKALFKEPRPRAHPSHIPASITFRGPCRRSTSASCGPYAAMDHVCGLLINEIGFTRAGRRRSYFSVGEMAEMSSFIVENTQLEPGSYKYVCINTRALLVADDACSLSMQLDHLNELPAVDKNRNAPFTLKVQVRSFLHIHAYKSITCALGTWRKAAHSRVSDGSCCRRQPQVCYFCEHDHVLM